MRVARRAGAMAAAMDVTITAAAAAATDAGSAGPTPNSIARNRRVAAMPIGTPIAVPAVSIRPASRATIQTIVERGAPSAMRTPISLVRLATRYDMVA